MARWFTEVELAEELEARFRANRNAVLSPATALRVAAALRAHAVQPSRDEVAKMICSAGYRSCEQRCMTCISAANVITGHLNGDPDFAKAPVPPRGTWGVTSWRRAGDEATSRDLEAGAAQRGGHDEQPVRPTTSSKVEMNADPARRSSGARSKSEDLGDEHRGRG